MSAVYEWTYLDQQPADAVFVTVTEAGGMPVAEVSWPANPDTPGGDYFYPTSVDLALSRALDVRDHYGFARVVIRLNNMALWDNAWGQLVPAQQL